MKSCLKVESCQQKPTSPIIFVVNIIANHRMRLLSYSSKTSFKSINAAGYIGDSELWLCGILVNKRTDATSTWWLLTRASGPNLSNTKLFFKVGNQTVAGSL